MRKKTILILTIGIIIAAFFMIPTFVLFTADNQTQNHDMIALPPPETDGNVSVESAIQSRRSVRDFQSYTLSMDEIAQLLWAGQGITEQIENPPAGWPGKEWPGGLKSAPSAGALYPLKLYLITGNVKDLDTGVYRYISKIHSLEKVMDGNKQEALRKAALGQSPISEASAVLIITGIYERSRVKYGDRAERYVHIETGAVSENIYLQCESLDLGTVYIGAFRDKQAQDVLQLDTNEYPLAILPIGKPG